MQALEKTTYRLWRYAGDELRDSMLVQTLVDSISTEFDISPKRANDLELVLTEVISNSIDHGILRLDSTLKKDPNGFEQFFLTRAASLSELTEGSIDISIDSPDGDAIRIVVQDSGDGFPFPTGELAAMPESLLLAYGRGLLIIQALCNRVTHIGNGNCVVLDFATT